MFYKGKKCDTRLYLLPAVGKKKTPKKYCFKVLQKPDLRQLFIDAAYYVNLASPDTQRLPLRAFVVKEGRKQGALTNRDLIKAAVIITDHQKERRKC